MNATLKARDPSLAMIDPSGSENRDNTRYSLLDPLRGLAALWVFTFHFEFSETFKISFPVLHSLFRVGHLGVPMFFVISGYCLMASSRSAIRKDESSLSFLSRRFLRIYPPYWCSIIVVASLPFVIELISALKTGSYTPPSGQNLNCRYIDFEFSDWLRFVTLTQVFYPDAGATDLQTKFTMLNAVYWTLAIEFQFYLAVTLALVFRKRFVTILAVVTLISLPCLLSPKTYVIGIFLPYWPMFALGIGLYFLLEKGWTPDRVLGRWALSIGGIAILSGLIGFALFVGLDCDLNAIYFGAFFASLLWFGKAFDRLFTLLCGSANLAIRVPVTVMITLGAMSYSLYLLHGRLQYLVAQLVRQIVSTNSIVFDILAIFCTCALCYPFYRYCEAPFFVSRRNKSPTSTCGTSIVACPRAEASCIPPADVGLCAVSQQVLSP